MALQVGRTWLQQTKARIYLEHASPWPLPLTAQRGQHTLSFAPTCLAQKGSACLELRLLCAKEICLLVSCKSWE